LLAVAGELRIAGLEHLRSFDALGFIAETQRE